MFAKLTGTIDTLFSDSLILDVNGVGYHVFVSQKTLSQFGSVGLAASLMIETHVREDHIHLYGFASQSEREWFKILTAVQGVGAKSALSILSVCPPDRLLMAIASGDSNLLRQAEGVGPKLAVRIVTELKDKVQNKSFQLSGSAPQQNNIAPLNTKAKTSNKDQSGNKNPSVETQPANSNIDLDAVSALINLGYPRSDAYTAVMAVRQKNTDEDSLQTLIRLALKELAA
jgi:holliday junction DNA helicase RuvA